MEVHCRKQVNRATEFGKYLENKEGNGEQEGEVEGSGEEEEEK